MLFNGSSFIAKIVVSHNKKLIVKLHPSPDEYNPSNVLKKINPEIEIIKTGNIAELIKKCILFIVIDASTSIIDANLLGKPVLSVPVKVAEFGVPTLLKNNSCAFVDISSFEEIFYQIINDSEFRNKIIKNANKSIAW